MVGWMKISVAIITFNEEDRLEATLESCREIADEIVVVDSLSTDGTVEMARRYGAEVFSVPFQDYGTQKNAALDRTSHPWVLNLDADERVSDTLKSEIIKIKGNPDPDCDGFLINRQTHYLGRWIRHSGWYPDRKLRLFRKDRSRWQGRIHERLVVEGRTKILRGDIIHHTYRDMNDHLKRINRYSTLQAEDIVSAGKRGLYVRAILLPPVTFLRFYLWKSGWLDGFPGLVIALGSSWGTALKYLKALELKREIGKRSDHRPA
jgi:glycosyltransferase involved in cell wall biosynthesis